jgi:NAD(P)-dependent dehydrogenase (short-subunit alcohol dehydrogenase family)
MKTVLDVSNYNGKLQRPLGSGFDRQSTAHEVIEGIDLTGKNVIVTGGNSGIGLETTKVLAAAGALIIVAARDTAKAKKNLDGLENVEVQALNLSEPKSVDAFAEKFIRSGRPLHLLINNAGIMWVPLRRNTQGLESQLATNYLGHFQLTARLWPALNAANGARVINVSSQGHQFGKFDFEDYNFYNREYETLQAYGQSKTASNLFALELDHRAKGYNVRAYSLHPGSIHGTELAREASIELFQRMGFFDSQGNIRPEILASLKSIEQGAATTVWCATSPLLNSIGGVYCEDADVAVLAERTGAGVMPYSLDESNARRLWSLSEELTGVSFEGL